MPQIVQNGQCRLPGGAGFVDIGGPWLQDYNHTNGLGYAISDGALWTLYNKAELESPATSVSMPRL